MLNSFPYITVVHHLSPLSGAGIASQEKNKIE